MTERIKKNKIKHKIFNHFNLAFPININTTIVVQEKIMSRLRLLLPVETVHYTMSIRINSILHFLNESIHGS